MRINPSLLMFILIIFVFSPSLQEWMTQGGTAWYRPYILWLATIIFVWWSVKRYEQQRDAEHNKEKKPNEL